MPPYLAVPHYHLGRLPVTTKVALTGFAVMILAAIGFAALGIYAPNTGYSTRGAQLNFLGDEEMRDRGLASPDEKLPMAAGRSGRERNEFVVHPHSFMMPVLYFVLCHLFEMSYAPRWLKIALYAVAAISTLAVIFAPILIGLWPAYAAVLGPAVVALALTYTAMVVSPTIQMWVSK